MKNHRFPKYAALAVAAVLLLLPFSPSRPASAGTTAQPMAASAAPGVSAAFQKDETVYGLLAPDGAVRRIEVVNHLSGAPGTWIDPGVYATVESLTAGVTPILADGQVRIESADGMDRYYQGTLQTDTPLPYLVGIAYRLDGKPVDAGSLSGADGPVDITMSVSPNPAAARPFRDRLVLQASVTLDMQYARDIRSDDAARMIAGRSAILSFTLLPGQSAEWTISFTAVDFRMSPITMTALLPNTGTAGLSDLVDGLDELRSGATSMAGAGSSLADGLTALSGGLAALDNGLADASAGLTALADGASAVQGGGRQLAGEAATLTAGMASLESAIASLATQGAQLSSGYGQLAGVLSTLTVPPEQVPVLSAGLEQLAQLNQGLQATVQGLESIRTHYAELSGGVVAMAAGLSGLSDGWASASDGLAGTDAGIRQLAAAAARIAAEAAALPDGAQQLADGQQALADALATLNGEVGRLTGVSDSALPSFAAPDGTAPRSVQFLLHTPELSPPAAVSDDPAPQDGGSGFFKKLMDLFKR